MTTLTDVLAFVQRASREDLKQIHENSKLRYDFLSRTQARNFRPGQAVAWDGRQGHMTGIVQRVNPKNIVVRTNQGAMWNVSASMLKPILEGERA